MEYCYKVLLVLIVFLLAFSVPSYALSWDTIKNQSSDFINKGEEVSNSRMTIDSSALVNGAANILTTIGVLIVLAGLLILGIKYMTATPDEAAKLKTKFIGLVVAGVVIIGAYGIWRLAGTVLWSIQNTMVNEPDPNSLITPTSIPTGSPSDTPTPTPIVKPIYTLSR